MQLGVYLHDPLAECIEAVAHAPNTGEQFSIDEQLLEGDTTKVSSPFMG
jgi:hypothetical protein